MTELIGHTQVATQFAEALQQKRLHHAWLLHGLAGVGKYRLAGLLAQRYLCERQTACGECHACRLTAASTHPDLQQVGRLEGKRDISIEQVRDLLGFLALSGRDSERRVVILDDADRMNAQAANALLKGLEEPSPGSLLLIVCHDLMRLPATIRSRCLLQHCGVLADDETRQVLQSLQIGKGYIDLAVALAEGCPGSVACMQDEAVARALLDWQALVSKIAEADVGRIEEWIRQHLVNVPHALVAKLLIRSAGEARSSITAYDVLARIDAALWACGRWPGEVVRHSLRAGPSLLATILNLRSALRPA
ncbi:MAG TPA: DNA polymerase III subunit [Mariprofundaceae bacterium]|nr:DNA polymerase III subunit [Mariprofundaceae bacterium]